MLKRFTLAACAACLVSPCLSLAADDPAAVVVTATRFNETSSSVPSNISIITRQDIRNAPAQNLPDVLSTRAGIDVRQLGGSMGRDATVDMRGFGATATSNTLILLDGLRVNPVDMGTIIWSAIALESVERIEIIRGSGTALYGDGATGGVINIITNKSGRPVASMTGTLGSYGYLGIDGQVANAGDKGYYNLFVNAAASDGYRQNSQQDQQTASGRAALILDHGEAFVDFAVYKGSSGQPGSVFSAAYRDDPRSTRTPQNTDKKDGYRVRPGLSYNLNNHLTFEGELATDRQHLDAKYISPFGTTSSDRVRETTSFTPRLRWRHDADSLSSETVFGFDYYSGKVTSDNTGFANQGAAQESTALYLQNVTKLTEHLSSTLAGRSQRMAQKAHQEAYAPFFSPAMAGSAARTRNAYELGLTYAVDAWRIYAKTGTTFRFANVDELFGFDVFFNPVFAGDLRPQHGTITEVGGSTALGAVKLRASVYRLDLTDEIAYDDALSANTNLSPTRRQGIEMEADWKIAAGLQAKMAYTRTNARFRDGAYAGNTVPLVPRDQLSAQVTWNANSFGSYTVAARHVGERRFDSDFTNSHGILAGYSTLDVQAIWNIKPWKITAKLINALDKKYSPLAGYSAFYNDTYYYPADRRSLFVSGRFDF